jgi:hypothetical protein
MDQPQEYRNHYNDVDQSLEKTMRYRQMIGLITSSSIRSFRDQNGVDNDSDMVPAYDDVPQQPVSIKTPIDDNNITIESDVMKHDELIPMCDDRNSTDATTTIDTTENVNRDRPTCSRRIRRKQLPIVLDVIQYLFHNNHNLTSSNNFVIKDIDTISLSHMKQCEQKRSKSMNLFSVQHHHPGYVPVELWQKFNINENNDARQSSIPSSSKESLRKEERTVCEESNEQERTALVKSKFTGLQFLPVCFDCGGILQPGVMNTTIRIVELKLDHSMDATSDAADAVRSRTQRRRESRFKAKLCKTQYQCTKQHQASIAKVKVSNEERPHSKSNLWQYIWQQQNKYFHPKSPTTRANAKSVYPFLNCCTQYYIVSCGSCGAQIYVPPFDTNPIKPYNVRNHGGNSRKNPLNSKTTPVKQIVGKLQRGTNIGSLQSASPMRLKADDSMVFDMSKHNAAKPVVKNLNVTHPNAAATGTGDTDELSKSTLHNPLTNDLQVEDVARVTVSSNSINGNERKRHIHGSVSHHQEQPKALVLQQPQSTTLLNVQRKKKKPRNEKGKNDLMSFLSSLNDR